VPRSREAKHRRRKPSRFLPARGEPSPRAPFAGSLRWEEKLSSFPRSPTHFNELSGGTPPRRLPRIRPPGSPAPFKEASGGGWTLAGSSAWPGGRALLGVFGKRVAACPARCTGMAPSPSGDAGGSRPFSSCPQASTSGGKIWLSRLLRRGNLVRASRRDRWLKASQRRVPLPASHCRPQAPALAAASPLLRREPINHGWEYWLRRARRASAGGRKGAFQRLPPAPPQPLASQPEPCPAPGSSPVTELGHKLELKRRVSKPPFYFPFCFRLFFCCFPSLPGAGPGPSPAPTCQP